MIIDLHTHTNASDANLSRGQLLLVAAAQGVEVMAIADHDTMKNSFASYQDPLRIIEACELSACDPHTGAKVHILCYLPKNTQPLRAHFNLMAERRARAGYAMLELAHEIYPVVTEDSVRKYCSFSGIIFRQNIMSVLMEYGYTREIYGDRYRELFNPQDGPCAVPVEYPDAVEALELVRAARGVAILAHPSAYGTTAYGIALVRTGLLDGFELEHPKNTESDKQALAELCGKHNLLVTGGSDYHGANSDSGYLPGDWTTDDYFFNRLLEAADAK